MAENKKPVEKIKESVKPTTDRSRVQKGGGGMGQDTKEHAVRNFQPPPVKPGGSKPK